MYYRLVVETVVPLWGETNHQYKKLETWFTRVLAWLSSWEGKYFSISVLKQLAICREKLKLDPYLMPNRKAIPDGTDLVHI